VSSWRDDAAREHDQSPIEATTSVERCPTRRRLRYVGRRSPRRRSAGAPCVDKGRFVD
jgi:hypothetical protein